MTAASTEERTARFDRWYQYPRAASPSVAFDGKTVYVISDRAGLPQAWTVAAAGGDLVPYFGGTERVARVLPRPTGPAAVVAVDQGGNERYQLLLTDASGAVVRPLTHDPARIHSPGAWDEAGAFYFASNARDIRFFDVYRIVPDDPSSRATLLRTEDALVDVADAAGDRVLLVRANTNLDSDVLLRVGASETNLLPHSREVTVFSAVLGPDRVYLAANPDREFAAFLSCSSRGGTAEVLAEFSGDVDRVAVARDGGPICLAYNDRGVSRLVLYDPGTGHQRTVAVPFDGVVGTVVAAPGGQEFFFDLSAAALGTEVFAVHAESGTVRQVTRASVAFPGARTVPQLKEVRASDGLTVPFWWYEPAEPARATLVYVHGGPESQARPMFAPLFGFLLEEGYRLIVPNVRGSTGYGRTYVHLDDVRRRMDSVRDLREVVDAVRQGQAGVPDLAGGRFGVIGGSYGGFMVLSSISTYPELFEAAVDVVGIANFVTFLERTGPWRRKVREDEYGSLAHDREFLESISPVHHADRIVTPLFVVHGQNDPRVPLFEAEQIVQALRARHVPVELLTYANEGHGLVRRENQRETYVRAAEFFARHLPRTGARPS